MSLKHLICGLLAGWIVFGSTAGFGVRAQEEFPPPTPGSSTIVGKIRAAGTNQVVAGATVRAYHLDSGQIFASRPSAGNGTFEIVDVPYGYVDLSVETSDGLYAADQVVNVPPDGKIALTFLIEAFGERPAEWWTDNQPRTVPGLEREATGVAELDQQKGKSFWKRSAGIAIIAVGAGAVLLAVASGDDSSTPAASPSSP